MIELFRTGYIVRRDPAKSFSTKLQLKRPTAEDKQGYDTAYENDVSVELLTLQTPFEEKEEEERKDRAYHKWKHHYCFEDYNYRSSPMEMPMTVERWKQHVIKNLDTKKTQKPRKLTRDGMMSQTPNGSPAISSS